MQSSKIRKILVIDDDPLQLEVVKDHLIRRGVEKVVCQSDGKIALNLLAEAPPLQPELVITDIHMPGVDGIEILSFLSSRNLKIPLILISGSGSEQLHAAGILAKSCGLDLLGILPKPLDPDQLDSILPTG